MTVLLLGCLNAKNFCEVGLKAFVVFLKILCGDVEFIVYKFKVVALEKVDLVKTDTTYSCYLVVTKVDVVIEF